jgi:hypothetical protein
MEEPPMNPLIQEFLIATLRHWLTMLGMWLLTSGYITGDASTVEKYAAGFAVLFLSFMWSYWNKYKGRINFLMALQTPAGTAEEDVKAKAKAFPPKVMGVLLALGLLFNGGCAAKSAPVLVAQASLGMAQTIEQLQTGAIELQQAGVIDARTALKVQTRLLTVNGMVEKVVPYLKAADRMTQSGVQMTQAELDALITQVYLALAELGLVSADVGGTSETAQYITLVRAAQTTLTTTMIELARLRVALEQ